jgi:hypothetical protein
LSWAIQFYAYISSRSNDLLPVAAGVSVVYKCNEAGGGLLAMKDGFATKYTLVPRLLQELSDDLVKNFDAHLASTGSTNRTITVVTGCTLTGDYHAALVTSCEKSISFSAEAGLEPFIMGKLGVSLLHSKLQRVLQSSGHRHRDRNTDCRALNCENNKNQCIFLNLIIARKRKVFGIKLKAAAEPRNSRHDRDSDRSSSEVTDSSSDTNSASSVEISNEYGEPTLVCHPT